MTLFPHYFSEEVDPSGGRNGLLGSSCECFIPPTGKIAAHLWVDL